MEAQVPEWVVGLFFLVFSLNSFKTFHLESLTRKKDDDDKRSIQEWVDFLADLAHMGGSLAIGLYGTYAVVHYITKELL